MLKGRQLLRSWLRRAISVLTATAPTLLVDGRDEDVDGGIGDFPNCKMRKRNRSALPGLELRESDASGYPAMSPSVTLKSQMSSSLFWSSCLADNPVKDHFPRDFCTKHMAPNLHSNSWCSGTTTDYFPSWGWKETGERQVNAEWEMWVENEEWSREDTLVLDPRSWGGLSSTAPLVSLARWLQQWLEARRRLPEPWCKAQEQSEQETGLVLEEL